MNETVIAVLVAAGIPSAITGFGLWLIQQKIQKREAKREQEEQDRRKRREEREKKREENEVLLLHSVNAAIALGEATAKAVQRIPDAHCNGDMHAALEYAEKVKHEQKEFLARQGIGSLYD